MALSRRTGQRFQASIWPGFVDAMTGLLLVLFFVLTIFMIMQFVLRETITGQETELDTLAGEVAALAQSLGLERQRSAQLDGELSELNATLTDAQSQIATLTAQRDQVNAALSDAETRITSFEAQVAALVSERDGALGRVTDLETAQAELETQQAELLNEQEALNLALAQARSEIDAGVEAARLAAAQRDALDALVEDLRRENADALGETETLAADLDAAKQALSDEEAARLAEAAAAQALRERLENADLELTSMTLALEQQRKQAEETLTLLAAAEAAQDNLDDQLLAALLQVENAEAAREGANDSAAAREAALLRELEDLRLLNADLQQAFASAQNEVNSLRNAQNAAGETASAREAALQRELDDLRIANTDLQTAVATAENTAAALRTAQEGADASAAALQRDLDDLRRANSDLETAFAAAQNEVTSLRSAQDNGNSALADARARINELEATAAADTTATNARIAELEAARAQALADLQAAQDEQSLMQARLVTALQRLEQLETAANSDQNTLRQQLRDALAARLAAETLANDQTSESEKQAALLAQAQKTLAEKEEISTKAQREAALLTQQVAALRGQLGQLQALLDEAKVRDAAQDIQLQSLGSELNTALARVAAEERQRRLLEEAERARLEEEQRILLEEQRRLSEQSVDLQKYRSEFFGRLRDILGTQEGVRIVGDRFIFSSEVLFPPGGAELSQAGQGEIAKIAALLRQISDDIPSEIDWVLQVDGHTDNIPLTGTGQFADNWELSQGRALSVVKYMVNSLGIPPGRLSANGFGQYQPLNPADTRDARAQNRRIEIKFTEK